MTEKQESKINAWVGAETGLLKSVDLNNKVATNHYAHFGKNYEVLSICSNANNYDEIFTAHVNGKVRKFDVKSSSYTDCYTIPGLEDIKCREIEKKIVNLYKTENNFISCTTEGVLSVWNETDSLESFSKFDVGPRIQCTAFNSKENLFASGGHCNRLKLWDMNNPTKPVFQAKNVKPNWLLIESPINERQVLFVPDGSGRIITTTGTSDVRLYDPKANRRPVLETTYFKTPIISAAMSERNSNLVFVGNTTGRAGYFDIRKMGKMVRNFTGTRGSIRNIVLHTTQPYLFLCGLDRHMYVFHEENATLKHKVYLKSKLNCLLVPPLELQEDVAEVLEKQPDLKRKAPDSDANNNSDESDDEMWNKMRKVSDDDDSDDSDL